MATKSKTLKWQETKNGVTIDCSLDVVIHPADSNVVLLIVPGVDGSADGYQDKYITIANEAQERHGAAVVRMSNPFITSFHWESNVRHALDYINSNKSDITPESNIEIRIMAHSAGATVVARVAHEYPNISQLLLINPATSLNIDKMKYGLAEFGGNKITVLFGSKDPNAKDAEELSKADQSARIRTFVIDGADHHFSGDAFPLFLQSPHSHLFSQALYL